MPKPNRNDCKNNGEQTNLLRIQGARSAVYKNLKWAIQEKKSKQGGGGHIACQVPDSYHPLATNKPLLALFSLFTNAITQLAAAIAIATDTLLASDCMQMMTISNQ